MNNIAGRKFNKLIAIKPAHIKEFHYKFGITRRYFWKFRCECGKEKIIDKFSVIHGKTKSCGCLLRKRLLRHGFCSKYAERSMHIFNRRWQGMKTRCYCKSHKYYYLYGGKGIKICDHWNSSFLNFKVDM